MVEVGNLLVDFFAAPPVFLCHTGPESCQSLRVQSLRGAVAMEGEGEGHECPDRRFPGSYPPRSPAD